MILKRIICYGVNNIKLRSNILSYLSEKYEIIGFCDSFYEEDILQGELFIPVNKIMEFNFDYIVVLSENETSQKQIEKRLMGFGVPLDKIVFPVYFYQDNILYAPNLLVENRCTMESTLMDGIVSGLSYSLVGIDEKILKGNFINISWHGLDIYYNDKFINDILKYGSIKKMILVFPYYYFNYDMSSSLYQYTSGQIFACRNLGDWHNGLKSRNTQIKNYIINEELFGEKIWGNTKWKKYCPQNENMINGKKYPLSSIWKNSYTETMNENIKIFEASSVCVSV